MDIYLGIYYRFIIGIGLCGFRGQEIGQSAVCKWRTRKAGGIIQSKVLRILGVMVLSPSLSTKDGYLSSSRACEFTLPPPFCPI